MAETPRRGRRSFGSRAERPGSAGPRATFRQLVPYLFEERGRFIFIAVLSVVGAAVSLTQPLLVGQVIDRVQRAAPLGWLLLALVLLVLASAALNSYQHYLLQCLGEGVVLSSRRRLVAKLLNLPISEFDRRRTGDLVSRVGSDTTLLRAVLTQGLVEAIGGSLIFIGALIAMLVIDPLLFLITGAIITLSLLAVVLLSSRIRPAVAAAQEKVGDLAASVDRAITSVRTLRAAGAAAREEARILTEADAAYDLGIRVARISALIVPVSFIALQVSLLTVLGVGGYRVASGAISVSQLVTFIIFLFMLIIPLGQAFGAITSVNQALGALGRIEEIVRLPTESDEDVLLAPGGVLQRLDTVRQADAPALHFDAVSFTYRSAAPARTDARQLMRGSSRAARRDAEATPAEILETPVLHEVSFQVRRGTRVALVGPSGAGKSTVLSLIERFYDPDSGSIAVHGVDVRSLDREELRRELGYVEQDAPVLAGTLRENLLISAPNASDAECERVLRAVNLGGLLERAAEALSHTAAPSLASSTGLSSGTDSIAATTDTNRAALLATALSTPVGERGIMLSGGERQRLAIARALLTAPPILLLDESTASLDGVNERLMRNALDSVATGRTLLVIAHRLSTVIDSDLIVVLDQGRVIGQGTHDELVRNVPLYRELAKHQLLVSDEGDPSKA